ncbi:MAG: response regulator [Candidatus Omnitrophica bacterium]|nr:response regulator [Candidatus Omnitrophota bacterium]MBU4478320.1 response regulator [Candidatus Omnitrophota bacterium]MCG2704248.1 response regulator [Candidatus Omnitrophota bacterium]
MQKRKILVVDDKKDFTAMVAFNLIEHGYEVRQENDAGNVVAAAILFTPDVIMLDVMMPEIDGLTVLKRLKENEITKTIPVIMVTAVASASARLQALGLLCADYVVKPVNTAVLLEKIENVLGPDSERIGN